MPEIAYQAAQRRVMVVQELMESWKRDHESTIVAHDIDQILQEAAELREPMKRLIKSLDRGPQPSSLTRDWPIAYDSGSLLNMALEMFAGCDEMIERIQSLGYTLDNLELFDDARRELVDLRDRFSRIWSLPEKSAQEHSRKEIADGNFSVL